MPTKDILFCLTDDWHRNACLGWSFDEWELYTTGYKEAADILAAATFDGNYLDSLIYPIVFNYRHYIELRLKLISYDGNLLLRKRTKRKNTHKLQDLWMEARGIAEEIWPGGNREELDDAEKLINQFIKIDPTSTTFRYPDRRKDAYSLPRHINTRNLKDVMGRLAILLDGVSWAINE